MTSSARAGMEDRDLAGIHGELRAISALLTKTPWGTASVTLAGSVACGHWLGPKLGSNSLNRFLPISAAEHLIEVDVRVVWPNGTDVASIGFHTWVGGALGTLGDPQLSVYQRWGRATATALTYKYELNAAGVLVEWEFAHVSAPFVEVALFWQFCFDAQEIATQLARREVLRTNSRALALEKDRECSSARAQLISDVSAMVRQDERLARNVLRAAGLSPPDTEWLIHASGKGHLFQRQPPSLNSRDWTRRWSEPLGRI